ncbi:retrotransposon gag protein [Cucumis melo var. makuwa]|uniref:Retrotransposon gag protein n=1 Tax=Cucumis melo var. makuwa TaxID=1194695 RepID=A0A5A7TJ64_CUCMM|nr:retrotransposon gag protein [Cucumis melo var. makuwa]TYK08402.1 retrotransposon gag protein [Cucumis melo var. makuwa]
MTSNSQNKEEPIEDEGEEWIGVAYKKERQTSFVQTNPHFHQKHSKENISHKKKGRRNKKMWKPKPIKRKDEDFLQPRRSITLAEFLSRRFLEDHPEEILEVTACHTTSIVEVNNNYDSYEEVDNSNEIKQRTSVFDRIKSLTTRSSVFQRLSMATKEEENQCPTYTYTRTSAFKRLSISTLKKDRPSTSSFDRLKMTNDQQQRKMKSLKAKPFHGENGDDKIHSRVPSRMKRKVSVDINIEASFIFLKKLRHCFFKFKFKGFKLHRCSREDLHLHLSMCCNREACHRKYVAAEKIVVSNMLQPRRSSSQSRRSSSQIYYNREDRHLKTLQPRRASSSFSHMCCSRGDQHLHLYATQAIIIFNATQAIIIFSVVHAIIIFNVEGCRQSSSSMQRDAGDTHLQ